MLPRRLLYWYQSAWLPVPGSLPVQIQSLRLLLFWLLLRLLLRLQPWRQPLPLLLRLFLFEQQKKHCLMSCQPFRLFLLQDSILCSLIATTSFAISIRSNNGILSSSVIPVFVAIDNLIDNFLMSCPSVGFIPRCTKNWSLCF